MLLSWASFIKFNSWCSIFQSGAINTIAEEQDDVIKLEPVIPQMVQ